MDGLGGRPCSWWSSWCGTPARQAPSASRPESTSRDALSSPPPRKPRERRSAVTDRDSQLFADQAHAATAKRVEPRELAALLDSGRLHGNALAGSQTFDQRLDRASRSGGPAFQPQGAALASVQATRAVERPAPASWRRPPSPGREVIPGPRRAGRDAAPPALPAPHIAESDLGRDRGGWPGPPGVAAIWTVWLHSSSRPRLRRRRATVRRDRPNILVAREHQCRSLSLSLDQAQGDVLCRDSLDAGELFSRSPSRRKHGAPSTRASWAKSLGSPSEFGRWRQPRQSARRFRALR